MVRQHSSQDRNQEALCLELCPLDGQTVKTLCIITRLKAIKFNNVTRKVNLLVLYVARLGREL